MYAKPLLTPLDPAASHALCCHVRVGDQSATTPLCAVPFCQVVDPCSVSVDPIAVVGPISTPSVAVGPFTTPAVGVGPVHVGPIFVGGVVVDPVTFGPVFTPGVSVSG